jgi:hypothetical protein
MKPDPSEFTRAEWDIIQRHRTPRRVQAYLKSIPYNFEKKGETLVSFRQVVKRKSAHCLEAALAAAVILEQHGYPPLLLSFESVDQLDHVLFVFKEDSGWGSVARSRDNGLHGRKPVFRTARDLALSYVDPYVDYTGRITGYAVVDLNEIGKFDWRFAAGNMWRLEQFLIDYPHRRIVTSDKRYAQLLKRYTEFKAKYPDKQPMYYDNQETWM